MKFAQRDYVGKDVNIDKLEGLIEEFFREEGFKIQSSKHPNGYLIQAKKGRNIPDTACSKEGIHDNHRGSIVQFQD